MSSTVDEVRAELGRRVDRFCYALEEQGFQIEVLWRPHGQGSDCEIWITVPDGAGEHYLEHVVNRTITLTAQDEAMLAGLLINLDSTIEDEK